jgi:hypothetical protein
VFITVPIALFGWIAVGLLLFSIWPARRALITCVIAGTLFLPNAGYTVPIIRAYDKQTAITLSAFVCAFMFAPRSILAFRPHWVDIPMAVWCLVPIASSLTNGLGLYDGLSDAMGQFMLWGLPYLLGRMYLTDLDAARDLMIGLFLGGVFYVPFCLWEMKGGPFWHVKLYGFYPHNYWEQLKPGGWRPSVFFIHGLWLAGYMACAGIAGACLAFGGRIKRILRVPVSWLAVILGLVIMRLQSNGAMVLFALSVAVLFWRKWRNGLVLCLILGPILYMGLRVSGMWSGEVLVTMAEEGGGSNPAGSLNTRLELENRIIGHAMNRPLFGWGGWGRSMAIQSDTGRGTWTEGVWTMAVGRHGLVGLAAWCLSALLPATILLWKLRRESLLTSEYSPLLALLLIVVFQATYGIVVLDFSPTIPLISGTTAAMAVAGIASKRRDMLAQLPGGQRIHAQLLGKRLPQFGSR